MTISQFKHTIHMIWFTCDNIVLIGDINVDFLNDISNVTKLLNVF